MRKGSLAGRRPGLNGYALRVLWALMVSLILAACDFNGPWSFYPEETEIYGGIFTYGYVIEGESPRVCFSKTYQLEESSAENFAFYDSAYVTVTGNFEQDEGGADSLTLVLEPERLKPSCFVVSEDLGSVPKGVGGEKYSLQAYFKWDSAGTTVESEFSANTKIPVGFEISGVNAPQADGSYKWYDIDYDGMEFDFLEYPRDMDAYNFATVYDSSIGGMAMTMEYSLKDGGENQNIFLNHMLGGMLDEDSMGFGGVAIHDPLETSINKGFQENRVVAGINMLDSIVFPNMNFPIGEVKLHFYATDSAFFLYHRYVLNSFSDPTVQPRSNIENGMGVFGGMSHLVLPLTIKGEGVAYSHIAVASCAATSMIQEDSWNTKSCRLFQDVFCSGLGEDYDGETGDLYVRNEKAPEYYREGKYKDKVEHDYCYAPAIKAAMMLDTTSWSVFLPKSISKDDKDEAYGDALKRYCVASNFKSNSIADCAEMEKQCMESLEESNCKEYLWQWCADRNWDIEKYEQCGSALVSRYYLEVQQSSILENAVKKWCKENEKDPQCKGQKAK